MVRRIKRVLGKRPRRSNKRRGVRRLRQRAMSTATDFLHVTDSQFRAMGQDGLTRAFMDLGLEDLITRMAMTSNTHGRVVADNYRRQTVLEHTINMLIANLGSGVSLRTDWIRETNEDHNLVAVLRMAAFFHDSGKVPATSYSDFEVMRPITRGHDELSISYIQQYRQDLRKHFTDTQIDQMISIVEHKEVFFGRYVSMDSIRMASESVPGVSGDISLKLLMSMWIADSSTLPEQVWYNNVGGSYPRRDFSIMVADNIQKISMSNILEICAYINDRYAPFDDNLRRTIEGV